METDLRYKELRKLDEELSKYKVMCKCGHKTILINSEKAICSWCGNYVYKNKKLEFRERMKQCLKDTTKNQNQQVSHTNVI